MSEQSYTVLDPATLEVVDAARREFAEDVLVGLSERPKRLSSRYFYDAKGSALFQAITDLDEYYPTRLEAGIFESHKAQMLAPFLDRPLNLIDLGAGDGRKTVVLLDYLRAQGAQVRYVPIDISESAMADLVERMSQRYPDLPIGGLVSEYFDGVRWLSQASDRHNLVLFLGSNIGNFDKPRARAFLRRLWNALKPGDHALIGFDLKKDIEALLAAYNDREGVTAQFNLNLLARINAELGGHFDLSKWRHFATYSVFTGAMESYLVAKEGQRVAVDGLRTSFDFAPWEPIHTEYSYKYLEQDIGDLARASGFEVEARFFDEKRWFCDALWRAEGR